MARPNEELLQEIEQIGQKSSIKPKDINRLLEIRALLPDNQKSQVDGALNFLSRLNLIGKKEEAEINLKIQEQKIISYYKEAYDELLRNIEEATTADRVRRVVLLHQIRDILIDLGDKSRDWTDEVIPSMYAEGQASALDDISDLGFPMGSSLLIHEDAVEALVDDIATSFLTSFQGVENNVRRIINESVRQRIIQRLAVGKITGEGLKKVAEQIQSVLKDAGVTALIDRGGKRWQLDTYAKMLVRTKMVESHNVGMINQMQDLGHDLVKFSQHYGACPLCVPWEGRIVSISGEHPEYPSFDEARSQGMFHPNCRHVAIPYFEKLMEVSYIYNPYTGEYIDPKYESPLKPVPDSIEPQFNIWDNFRVPTRKYLPHFVQTYFQHFTLAPGTYDIYNYELKKIPIDDIDAPSYGSDNKVRNILNDVKEGMHIPPIFVTDFEDQSKYFVFDGNHRLEAMKRLGVEEIPVVHMKLKAQ